MVLYFQYNQNIIVQLEDVSINVLFLLRSNTGCFNVLHSHFSNIVCFHFSLYLF